jgi:hypothetical protein
MHCSVVSSKVNAEIVQATMMKIMVTRLEEIIALIVANRDISGTTTSN